MRSIRTSLVLGTTCATLVVLLAAGAYVYYGVRDALFEQFDVALRNDATTLTGMADVYPTKLKLDFDGVRIDDFAAGGATYIQCWVGDAATAYRTPSLGDHDLTRFGGTMEEAEFRWLAVGDRAKIRAVGFTFVPNAEDIDEDEVRDASDPAKPSVALGGDYRGRTATLVLARRMESIDAFLTRLRTMLLVLGLIASAVAVATLWTIIRRNLDPLDQLARRIATLRAGDVAARIELPRVPSEIQPVVDRLNELLERIDTAMQRERSFSAHVAHELRTPVAALRSTLEVVRSRPREVADYDAATGECVAIVQQMQRMVESLLHLFRLEAGQVAPRVERFDLRDLVVEEWSHFESAARERRLRVVLAGLPHSIVVTDRGLLGLAIRNLMENTVVHSDEGGFARITLAADGAGVKLSIRNSGNCVAPDAVPRVFDRFWRGDEARSSSGVHIGLGLSLVKKIAAVLGAEVTVTAVGDEFDVALLLDAPLESASA